MVSIAMAAVQCMDSSVAAGAAATVSAAQADSCASAALASVPSAADAYNVSFVPARCTALSTGACAAAPGCRLAAHGNHFDCVSRAR